MTLFSVILKFFEMIIPNRLENFQKIKVIFPTFSLVLEQVLVLITEVINYFVERGGKIFACFFEVRKAFDTVSIDGLMHKLLSELGIQGKLFSAIKSLYSDIQCYVYFNGTTTDLFPVTQGSGQGRVLAAFMYKVYINKLIKEIINNKEINGVQHFLMI